MKASLSLFRDPKSLLNNQMFVWILMVASGQDKQHTSRKSLTDVDILSLYRLIIEMGMHPDLILDWRS